MEKKNSNKKIKLIVIILAVALVCALAVFGHQTGFIDKVFHKDYVEQKKDGLAIEHSNDKEKSKQYSDEKKDDQSEDEKNSGKHRKPSGKKKDLGGGLYLNPDGSIETEILP